MITDSFGNRCRHRCAGETCVNTDSNCGGTRNTVRSTMHGVWVSISIQTLNYCNPTSFRINVAHLVRRKFTYAGVRVDGNVVYPFLCAMDRFAPLWMRRYTGEMERSNWRLMHTGESFLVPLPDAWWYGRKIARTVSTRTVCSNKIRYRTVRFHICEQEAALSPFIPKHICLDANVTIVYGTVSSTTAHHSPSLS